MRVWGVDDLSSASPATLAELARHPGFELLEADCADPIAGIDGLDLVAHFACPASPADHLARPFAALHACGPGTVATVELARTHGARYVVASSSEVYGDPAVHPQPETYTGNVRPDGPRSAYVEGKRYSEAIVSAHRRLNGLPATMFRIFNTYGPHMRRDDGRVLPAFVSAALAGEPLPVDGDGTQTRSLCHVEDLVDGFLSVLAAGVEGPVNVGNDAELTVLEMAALVIAATGSTAGIRTTPALPDDPVRRRPDLTLARSTGWTPRISPEEGITEVVAHWLGTEESTRTSGWSSPRTGAGRFGP